ncbi:MAG: threonine--tRNA ligase [Candidatus Nealsonbacteria bacterium RBG_13_42_11]|uniref:Threonine--tRNA ligase n=1 Tax=Candidatus Nealsonbacteria bacterium RBG_13_42_11 TaxID=1801663 RepID=A0A1G2E0H8_9BACT|nr:MAG: threonine--tRNA ligase [Candidatus Nealsonbacteria bacterium RBG_13_42_11]
MAYAVQELYPETKFGIGPAIENGFYYDFDLKNNLTPQDLPRIEKKMRELIREDLKFEKKIVSKTEAKKLFKDQPYKLELLDELKDDEITIYESGKFTDLCAGPHIKTTKEIPSDAFKLTKIAGAYWRGSEKNKMLTRIYGIAFPTKKELEDFILKEKEAEKRDHRLLGQRLELFMFDEEVGAGLPLWLPKGTILRKIIGDYLYKELTFQGYQWLTTPHIAKINLWQTSGHWNLYRENMYSPIKIDEEEYILKPMNCPFHVKVYNSKIRSYKDLPLYLAELGTVYRYEKSGVLHGLTRVRGFTQDDAHLICTPKQLSEELVKLLKSGVKILNKFGFKDFDIYLSTRPEKYAGTLANWEKATNILKYVLKSLKLKYEIDPAGGVFYGPKIDIKVKDSLGRPWQCTTIQVDFNLPERFQMTYVSEKGKKETPIMIHRALLGSLERFIGVLIEHHAGNLPLWLSPVQIWVIPLGDRHEKYAKKIAKDLEVLDLRCQIKNENETVSKKIREGEIQKIPYILVVGDEEMKKKTVRVRERGKGDLGMMNLNKFLKTAKIEK